MRQPIRADWLVRNEVLTAGAGVFMPITPFIGLAIAQPKRSRWRIRRIMLSVFSIHRLARALRKENLNCRVFVTHRSLI
jgi:hypothetical protein